MREGNQREDGEGGSDMEEVQTQRERWRNREDRERDILRAQAFGPFPGIERKSQASG